MNLLPLSAPRISITGDRVRARSWFNIWIAYFTRKQYIPEKYNNLLLEHKSCQSNYSRKITHKYISCRTTWKHRRIFIHVALYWQRVFLTLPNLNAHPTRQCIIHLWYFPQQMPKTLSCKVKNLRSIKWHDITSFDLVKTMPITFEQGCTSPLYIYIPSLKVR